MLFNLSGTVVYTSHVITYQAVVCRGPKNFGVRANRLGTTNTCFTASSTNINTT